MKLWRYIQGNRKGTEAHRVEIEAMKDPFLADALEGYEKTPGNHQRKAARLQKEITRRQQRITNKSTNKKTDSLKAWNIAVGILIAAGIGIWFLLDNTPVKDTSLASRLEEKSLLVAVDSIDSNLSDDPVEVIPKKPQTAQAVTDNAEKKEIQKIAEPVSEESPVVTEETEAAPVPETQAIFQEAEANAQTTTGISINDKEPAAAITRDEHAAPITSDAVSPQPVVGMQAYMDYIKRNTKHPTDDECRDVKGSVVVMFKIGQSGRPYNIRVTEGLCSSINKEAIRLIINGPDWKKGSTSDEATITIPF
ncbi:MAG: hypothetical protein LBU44_02720 [Mediterranea sp.]|jgi:hypothetical protein|nr:hypothetical protein [Mediterranea sp.]